MLGLIVKIKNWIKECFEMFNEAEKFKVENNLLNPTDYNF